MNTYHNSYFKAEKTNEKEDNGDIEEPEKANDDHPVFQAIKDSKDNVESVRDYFEIDGLSVEKQDTAGMTVLMHACWKGYENIVKFLIKQVCDVSAVFASNFLHTLNSKKMRKLRFTYLLTKFSI